MQTNKCVPESVQGVPELLKLSGDESIKELLADILELFKRGYGRYNSDGSYDAHSPIFGNPVKPAGPAHRRLRASLRELILYSQGYAQLVEQLHQRDLVSRHDECNMLYEEVHIKRSQMLLNEYFKTDGKTIGTTLSDFTSWGVANNSRNRSRIRDKITPIFEYYGLWDVRRDKGGYAMFTAGPALLMFAECVLDQISDQFDGVA